MVYKWKTGSQHKVSAAVAGAEMDRLTEEGRLTPEDLVEDSRPEDAPLHAEFEWDDSVAAEKYREDQARAIIRHLTVQIEANNEQYQVRKYFIIQEDQKVYEPIQLILRDEDKTKMLLEQAKREMLSFKAKYACLKELSEVIKAMDSVA